MIPGNRLPSSSICFTVFTGASVFAGSLWIHPPKTPFPLVTFVKVMLLLLLMVVVRGRALTHDVKLIETDGKHYHKPLHDLPANQPTNQPSQKLNPSHPRCHGVVRHTAC